MKKTLSLILSLALALSVFAVCIPANAVRSTYDFATFSKNELITLADGVTLSTMVTADNTYITAGQRINILKADLNSDDISMEMVLHKNASNTLRNVKAVMTNDYSTALSSTKRPIAGFNADWFHKANEDMNANTTVSGYPMPFGCDILDGEIICSNYSGAEWPYGGAIPPYVLGITYDNKVIVGEPRITPYIKNLTTGVVAVGDGINRSPVKNSIMVYNNRMNPDYGVNSDAYEVEIQVNANQNRFYIAGSKVTGTVTNIYTEGTVSRHALSNSNIIITCRWDDSDYRRTDRDSAVVFDNITRIKTFNVGDQIEVSTRVSDNLGVNKTTYHDWMNCKSSAGGNFLIMKNGVAANEAQLAGDTSFYPSNMVGFDADGNLLVASVTKDSGKTAQGQVVTRQGLKFSEMTKFARDVGFDTCFLLDGGGSTTMITATSATNGTLVDRGNYDDKTGIRSVFNSFIIFKDENKTTENRDIDPLKAPDFEAEGNIIDMNNDGAVDVNDSLYLIKNVMNPASYPIKSYDVSGVSDITINAAGEIILTDVAGRTANLGKLNYPAGKHVVQIACDTNGVLTAYYSTGVSKAINFN